MTVQSNLLPITKSIINDINIISTKTELDWMNWNGLSISGNQSCHLIKMDRIIGKFHSHGSPKVISDATAHISDKLTQHGIFFDDNKALPISLMPTVVCIQEATQMEHAGGVVRQVLNRILEKFVEEHRYKRFDGPMHRFFTPYYKWWDCIAAENRRNDHIQLMRYDAVRDNHGRWTFMETNTACPGGTIHCARIRDAWFTTELGQKICQDEIISEFPIDSPAGFVRFMAEKAAEINPAQPNIAILNYRGTYTNELASLQRCHMELRSSNEIAAGELLLGDLRDITCIEGQAYLNGKPVALIYNKIDQLQIDPHSPDVRGWLDASVGTNTEFLNSMGAMYLAETKRTLAMLSDPAWRSHLNLSKEEEVAIREVIPFTRLIEDFVENGELDQSLPARHQNAFVLKADALTRGSGVVIGDQVTADAWKSALDSNRLHQGIAQLKCHLPFRNAIQPDENGNSVSITEFYGIDIFFFAEKFGGMVSRSHTNQIFNVGNGGRESPVLIVGGSNG